MARLKQAPQSIGTIQTQVVGVQYHETRPEPGMQVVFEREHDNPHDTNALLVETPDGDPIGHLPRRTAAWLARLVDAGQVRLTGTVESAGASEHSAPLTLQVMLAPKGRSILRRDRQPTSGTAALHQTVLSLYRQSQQWDNPQALTELLDLLQPLDRKAMQPRTRLLLELVPERARALQQTQAQRQNQEFVRTLQSVRLGPALSCHDLTVFPLHLANGHQPGYLLLGQALEQDLAEVTEVSDSGSVPELRLVNRAPQPILIPEGEIVVGGKQNRVINITILVPAGATFTLPVSCVEQGRWHQRSQRFAASYCAPPNLRANKLRSVQAAREQSGEHTSDQGRVWEDVASCLHDNGILSTTASLTDAYEQLAEQAREIRERLVLPEDASGALVLQEGRVIGLDLFDHHATFGALWPRLRDAYALMSRGSRCGVGVALDSVRKGAEAEDGTTVSHSSDAGRTVCDDAEVEDGAAAGRSWGAGKTVGNAFHHAIDSHATAADFLTALTGRVAPAGETLGLGQAYDIGGDGLIGSALWHDGRVCHLAAFAQASERDEAPDSSGGSGIGSDHDLPGYVIPDEEATVEPWAEF